MRDVLPQKRRNTSSLAPAQFTANANASQMAPTAIMSPVTARPGFEIPNERAEKSCGGIPRTPSVEGCFEQLARPARSTVLAGVRGEQVAGRGDREARNGPGDALRVPG